MIRAAFLGLVAALQPLLAQELPALYAVTGVAADDVLNIRLAPDPASAIIGTLAPNAQGVEVIAIADGWASVDAGEQLGFAAARFLQREGDTPWYRLDQPVSCFGAEPFWSFDIDAPQMTSTFTVAETPEPRILPLEGLWPGESWSRSAALSFAEGMAVLRPEACNDGMSELGFGIGIEIFLNTGGGHRISGCCTLAAGLAQD